MNQQKKFDWNSVGFDFGNWEEEKIWALDLPVVELDIKDLLWHFDAPWWSNDKKERWTVTPWDVINKAAGSSVEQEKTRKADLGYPIDVLENKGKWLILDGIHRLTKAYQLGHEKIRARIVPRERLPEIISGHPIELPGKSF